MGIAQHRCDIYAAGTAILQQDKEVAGAEGIFNQALTNGLLAVAAHSIPGHPAADASARPPSASRILDDLAAAFGKDGETCLVDTGEENTDFTAVGLVPLGRPRILAVPVDKLRDAIRRTDPTRHGRAAAGSLTEEDIEALAELDGHPAQRALVGRYADEAWRRGRVDDLNEYARAEEYLGLFDEDERVRRAEDLPSPSSAPGDDLGVPLQACPVCGTEALVAAGTDEMGYGIAPGVCVVCSYRRSEDAAHELNLEAEWEARWEGA